MLQVKIIREKPETIETSINQFLRQIGTVPGTRVSVSDIKLHISDMQHTNDVAMIIYNQIKAGPTPQPRQPIPQLPLNHEKGV